MVMCNCLSSFFSFVPVIVLLLLLNPAAILLTAMHVGAQDTEFGEALCIETWSVI
jgi:hypothetical protein